MKQAYKNTIITISGEPVSGKGTAVKGLRKYFEDQGYNVVVVSVGHIFRKVAIEKYKDEHPEIAAPTIEQVSNDPAFADRIKEIDLNLDSYIAQKGKEINSESRPNDIYIIDSRLAFRNIPDSFSIRLTVDEKVAGQRVFNDETRGEEDKYDTLEQATEETIKRKKGEIDRYKGIYDVDLTDESNYNLLIDTSYAKPEDIIEVITNSLALAKIGEGYSRNWASPKWFLPLQGIKETCGFGGLGKGEKEFKAMLQEEGYDYSKAISVIQVEGYYYIIEGHHRNFCANQIGMSLVPYEVIAKDDEVIPGYKNTTAKDRVYNFLRSGRYLSGYVYDHEPFFDEKDEKGNIIKPFYYTDIYGKYPEIPEAYIEKEDEAR